MIKINRPTCPNEKALASGNYKHPENKKALSEASNDKCMYCESKISHIDFGHVEHIKPKAEDKYPELTCEWSNLGYVCPKCNNKKSDKYHQDQPYIDPYSECPADHLYALGWLILQKNGSERGEITIRDIDLNRVELIEKRQTRIMEIQKAMDACYRTQNKTLRDAAIKQLHAESSPDKEYSLFVKSMLDTHSGQTSSI